MTTTADTTTIPGLPGLAPAEVLPEAVDRGLISADLVDLLRSVLERSLRATAADGSVLEVVDGDNLLYVGVAGAAAGSLGTRVARHGSLSGHCATTGEVLLCGDSEVDERVDREACRRVGVRSMICGRLRLSDQVTAVLKVMSGRAHAFNDQAVETIAMLSEVLSEAGIAAARRNVELGRRADQYRALARNFPDGAVFLLDDRKRVLIADGPLVGAFELLPRGVEGQTVADALTPEHAARLEPRLDAALAGEAGCYSVERDDLVLDVHVSPVAEARGRIFGVLVTAQNVTERATTIARLEEVDRLKDEFISLVTHELRTPLTSIIGYLELIAEENTDAGIERFVDVAVRNSDRLKSMVDQLLTLFRFDSGRASTETEPVSLHDVICDSVDTIRPIADRKGVEVVLDNDPAGRVLARTDALGQIADNLISNAVKYTPAGGTVTIVVTGARDAFTLTVQDSGIGIPEDELPRVFERFFRASTAVDAHIQGTGLGLAVTKALTESFGGTITVERVTPAGTRFTVVLPAA